MRILIADDQKHARSGLRALIRATLHQPEIREAANGLEAERACEEFLPDLVLMDVHMPEEDGLAATRWIKTRRPQTRVLVLSIQPDHRADALAAGADGFASKCDTPESLLTQLAVLGFPPVSG